MYPKNPRVYNYQFNLNYNQFFKEVTININKIFTYVIGNFAKFNLNSNSFYFLKDQPIF